MTKSINICFEFNLPDGLPMDKFRQAMAAQLRERYPTINIGGEEVTSYHDIVLEMFPKCGCRETVSLSDVPLESLKCRCDKSYLIKINKVRA
jgi:hypothetical protein